MFLNGYSTDGGLITGSEIFRFSSASSTSIFYTGESLIETLPGSIVYSQPTRMTLTFTGPGTIVQDATTQGLNNANGDVGALWHATGQFSVNILIEAQVVQPGDPNYGNWETANELFNRLETVGISQFGTASSVDTGFFYENVGDADGDGVLDNADNCTLVPNTDQRDTDADGYGNICDADLDNSGRVNATDLAIFKTRFRTSDPDADFNGDSRVNATDLAILKTLFARPPGPSAVAP
jgi:hypothetical protein